MLTVFCLLVNEDWNVVLYDYIKASNLYTAIAYIGFVVVVGNFLLL
jgi:hypothetical protein